MKRASVGLLTILNFEFNSKIDSTMYDRIGVTHAPLAGCLAFVVGRFGMGFSDRWGPSWLTMEFIV